MILPVRQFVVGLLLLFAGSLPAFAAVGGTIRYATGFSVTPVAADSRCNLITVNTPWPDAKESVRYLLKPRGTQTPKGYEDAEVIEVPVRRMVALSTPMGAFIDRLGLVDRLVGFSETRRIHSVAIRNAAAAGRIAQLDSGMNIQVEKVLDLDPDVIFSFAVGSFRDSHPKLVEAGLKVVLVAEYVEEHPLGRAEWIKFFGLFLGKSAEAEAIFDAIEKRYQQTAALARTVQKRPSVITGAPFGGSWYVAGGRSFIARLLQDAGADYLWRETTFRAAQPMDVELVYARGEDADFWISPGSWASEEEILQADSRLGGLAAFQNHHIYNSNRRVNAQGGNDYWESGVLQPDVLLKDLISILHSELLPDYQPYYYTHLQ